VVLRERLPRVSHTLAIPHRCVGPDCVPDPGNSHFLHPVGGLIGCRGSAVSRAPVAGVSAVYRLPGGSSPYESSKPQKFACIAAM
jgi:hypothetical protein